MIFQKSDPNIRSVIQLDGSTLILIKLNIHSNNIDFMYNL